MTALAEARTSPGSRAVDAGSAFAMLWAAAIAVHLLNQTFGRLDLLQWVTLAAVAYVLGRPSSAHRLAVLAAAQLLETVWNMPLAPDHQVLAAFVNVCLLVAYFSSGRPPSAADLVHRLSAGARFLTLVAYAAAALAKYNTDFLHAATSCAAFMAERASFGFVSREDPLATAFLVMTISAETMIPILLLLPRTRRWGVLFAASFHFMLSASPAIGVGDFTLTLWALFCLFLPVRDIETIGDRLLRTWRASPLIRRLDPVPRWVLAIVALSGIWLASLPRGGAVVSALVWDVSVLMALWVLVVAFRVLLSQHAETRRLGRPTAVQFGVLALMLAFVSGPYLGFGTSSHFTMFSGIRTEDTGTNHLFLPSYHLVDSQNDGLIVLSSEGGSSVLESAAEVHSVMPRPEVHRILQHEQFGGRFETLDGKRIVVEPYADSPLRTPPSWWSAKWQHFRSYKLEGVTDPGYCSN
jgi:hypothetical protein